MSRHKLAIGLLCAASLFGQRKFSWQNSCFMHPDLPYCDKIEYAKKPKPAPKGSVTDNPSSSTELAPLGTSGGIDWRFADPSADAVGGLNFGKLLASPMARSLFAQVGALQGLTEADMKKVFAGLSAVDQAAVSLHGDRVVFLLTGSVTESSFPILPAGWRTAPVVSGGLLVGHAEAVDRARQRIGTNSAASELASLGEQLQANADFWAAGSALLAGPQASSAGVKRFQLAASLGDRLTSETIFEFGGTPDANVDRLWPAKFGAATIEGNRIHTSISMESVEFQQKLGEIAASPLGQRLGQLVQAARRLPVRNAPVTGSGKAVIYGLSQ